MKVPFFTSLQNSDSNAAIITKLLIPVVLGMVVLFGVIRLVSMVQKSYVDQEVRIRGRVFQPSSTGLTPLQDVEVSIISKGERVQTLTDSDGQYELTFAVEQEAEHNKRIVARYTQFETVGKEVTISPVEYPLLENINIEMGPLGATAKEKNALGERIHEHQEIARSQSENLKALADSLSKRNVGREALVEITRIINQYNQYSQWIQDDSILFSIDRISLERMRESLVQNVNKQDSLLQLKDQILLDLTNSNP